MTSTKICRLHLNTEGLTIAKHDLIHHLAEENEANMLLL